MLRKALLFGGIFLLVVSAVLFARQRFMVTEAGLLIETEPQATVLIDGKQVGTTPFEFKTKPGRAKIKLIPFSENNSLVPYETEVNLTKDVKTVVRRFFAPKPDASSGYTFSFDRVGGSKASLAVVSLPDGAELSVDGKVVGITPYNLEPIEPGDHMVRIAAPNHNPIEVSLRVELGYKLTAIVDLAKSEEAIKVEEKVAQPTQKKVFVEILTTPTGFLRVRVEPSTTASESAKVTPGLRYSFLEERSSGGEIWYKIIYEGSDEGWISGQYAKKVEETSN